MDLSMDLRTVPEVADGVASTPPLLNDSVMPYITPAMFFEWLRWKLETPAWILEHFESLVLDRARQDVPERQEAYQNTIERFKRHSDWNYLSPKLMNNPIPRVAVVPHSTPGNDPAFYQYEDKVFLLPEVNPNQFNLWGLDPQQFIKDMLDTNKGRIKELSIRQMFAAAGKFAKLRFPGANLGLDEQFQKQFFTLDGLAALVELENTRQAIFTEDRAFTPKLGKNSAALTHELERHRSRMFGRAGKSRLELLRGIVKREKEAAEGKPREDSLQPGRQPSWGDRKVLRGHPLPEPTRTRLASNGMAIVVSLGFLEDQAESVDTTHFHVHRIEPEIRLVHPWVKLELRAAFHPSIVIPFENMRVKDRALAQLQHTSRFNFLEDKGIQLAAYTLREGEGIANEPIFMLGSKPLTSLALLDESLRAFFWYKGYISARDLITERVRGQVKSKVVVRNNLGYDWVQKCTVNKRGNADQEIPAEPAETCSICSRPQVDQPVVLESAVPDNWGIPRQVPRFPDQLRLASASTLPVRRDVVPKTGKPAQPAPTGQDRARPVASHAPKTQRQIEPVDTRRSVPTIIVVNNGSDPNPHPNTQRQASARDAFQTPARTANAPTNVRAPSRKRMFSPDAPELYRPRPRLQGP